MSTVPSTLVTARPRPGWTEIAVGLAAAALIAVGAVLVAGPSTIGPVAFGILMTALSALAAGGGFAAAALVRVRSWAAFGIRRTTVRALLVGVAAGLVAFALKFPFTAGYVAMTGDASTPQAAWGDAAATNGVTLVLGLLFLGVLTPIGEELLFRGVVTTVLLRYGAVAGVVGSVLVFAVLHGAPIVMLSAVLVGLPAAELRRRTGSIWPGVAVHATFNTASALLAFLVLPAVTG